MIPKKIKKNYLNNVDESGSNMQNREYINLNDIWHDASEIPRMKHKNIIYQTNYCSLFNVHIAFVPTCLRSGKITSYSWNEFVKDVNMRRWAYIEDLLPKGGEK